MDRTIPCPPLHCPPHRAAHVAEHYISQACSSEYNLYFLFIGWPHNSLRFFKQRPLVTMYSVPCGVEGTLAQSSITSNAHSRPTHAHTVTELTHLAAPSGCRQLVQSDPTQQRRLHVLNVGRVQHAYDMHPPTKKRCTIKHKDSSCIPAIDSLFKESSSIGT